ncbi:hypothetical protein X975_04382, partial [Stegodyphus mimosarum]
MISILRNFCCIQATLIYYALSQILSLNLFLKNSIFILCIPSKEQAILLTNVYPRSIYMIFILMDLGLGDVLERRFYGTKIDYGVYKLNQYNSVYQAECVAVLKAFCWIKCNLNTHATINLYTDCLSLLQSLSCPDNNNCLIMDIKLLLQTINVKLLFHWIKAHVGFIGNERADSLAKMACTVADTPTVEISGSRRMAIARMKKFYIDKWREMWEASSRKENLLINVDIEEKVIIYDNIDLMVMVMDFLAQNLLGYVRQKTC